MESMQSRGGVCYALIRPKACVTWKTRLRVVKIHVLRDVRHPSGVQRRTHLRCVINVAGSDNESAPKQDKSHTFGQQLLDLRPVFSRRTHSNEE